MGYSVWDYLSTEASSSTTGGWNTAEGQDPSTVNDGMRQHKQNVANYLKDLGGTATATGTANAQTLTLSSAFTAYQAGQRFMFLPAGTNTGNVTLNVNSIGAIAVKKLIANTVSELAPGDLVSNNRAEVVYGASSNIFILLNPVGSTVRVVRTQVFTASGTYTPHANMVYCRMIAIGGGGASAGGAGPASNAQQYGSGGAGSLSEKIASAATIGASQTVTIGAGGTGGTGAGPAGGDTSVGALCIGKGGSGASGTTGGAGGVAGTGDVTSVGDDGQSGSIFVQSGITVQIAGLRGGSTMFGGGGVPPTRGAAGVSNGVNATGWGAGAAGGVSYNSTSTVTGGSGKGGIVIIYEYCSA